MKKNFIPFFGVVYSENGHHLDPEKVKDIHKLPHPENKEELHHFLGMITYMQQYSPQKEHSVHLESSRPCTYRHYTNIL